MATIAIDTIPAEHQLGRLMFIEPDTSKDPMENGFFASPTTKSVTHEIVSLHDIRKDVFSKSPVVSLKTHAFTAVKHQSALLSNPDDKEKFLDPVMIEKICIPEVEDIVKNLTGARKVIVIRAALRTQRPDPPPAPSPAQEDGKKESSGVDIDFSKLDLTKPTYEMVSKIKTGPARYAHLDYTAAGLKSEVRNCRFDISTEAEDIIAAEDSAVADGKTYEGRRYAAYSVWRPLKPVTRDPLAMCDRNSLDNKDLFECTTKRPGIKGPYLSDMYLVSGAHAQQQRWYWLKDQKPDEVLVVQFFDSHASQEGRPVGAPHGSPELLGIENDDWRESFEVRCIAFW